MGYETVCSVLYDGETFESKVLLESETLVFRGELRRTIPFQDITALLAEEDSLHFLHHGRPVEARVGPKAARWAERILNPKKRIDKLGVRPGEPVAVIGVTDMDFLHELSERTEKISEDIPADPFGWVFIQVESVEGLAVLGEVRRALTQTGAVWVIHPKGRKDFQDLHVFAAAKAVGLVDVKVAGFSPTHSAIKLMIPRAHRAAP